MRRLVPLQEKRIGKETDMACVNPDGKPTESGTKMLSALKSGSTSPEEIAGKTGLPLFRVRSGLRDLSNAGYAVEQNGSFKITESGAALV